MGNSSFDDERDGMRCIFGTTNTNPRPVKFHRKNLNENTQSTPEKRHSLGSITPTINSSGYQSSVSERISMIESSSSLESITEQTDKGLKGIYHSEVNGSLTSPSNLKTSHVMRSHSDAVNENRNWKRSSPVRYVQAFRFMVGPHARIQEFSSGGVQVSLTKKALSTFYLFFFLVLSLFYRSQMVNFKEIYHFSRF